MSIDIYESTFGNFLDATSAKAVILDGEGWGVLGYTDDCARIGDQRLLDPETVNLDNVDWIDVSSVTRAHGLGSCFISSGFYARCVSNQNPGREHVNVGNMLYFLNQAKSQWWERDEHGERSENVQRGVHAWAHDLLAHGVGWVNLASSGNGSVLLFLDHEDGDWSECSVTIACVDKTFAPSDRACEMPYCLHE